MRVRVEDPRVQQLLRRLSAADLTRTADRQAFLVLEATPAGTCARRIPDYDAVLAYVADRFGTTPGVALAAVQARVGQRPRPDLEHVRWSDPGSWPRT